MKTKLFLIIILFLAFIIRVTNLEKIPFGFFCDEASIGYNAFTILKKGTDEYGKPLPLFFQAFGEYKNPIQTYSTIPFILIFDLNEFSVRLASAVYGTLGIIAIHLLAKEVFFNSPNKGIFALFASLFLAISPWHIHFSRTSLEGLAAFVFFTTFATFLFLKAIRLNPSKTYYLSIIFFILALYSYFPARIFIPLFFLLINISNYRKLSLKKFFIGDSLFVILSLPLILHLINGEGLSRFKQVSIFSQSNLSSTQKIHHIVKNYLSHFSLAFLFTKGDIDYPGQFITRHSVRGMGELYWWQAPLVLLGCLCFFLRRKLFKEIFTIIFIWLLLYPLGSAFTIDNGPQATRSIIGVIPFQIISIFGLLFIYDFFLKNKSKLFLCLFIFLFLIIIGLSFTNYLKLFFIEYPKYSADYWGWQYGPRDIIKFFKENQNNYDDLIMTGSFNAPYIFFKFYAPNDCQNCKIGDLSIIDYSRRQLFALMPEEITLDKENILIKKKIFYPNQKLAFVIFKMK